MSKPFFLPYLHIAILSILSIYVHYTPGLCFQMGQNTVGCLPRQSFGLEFFYFHCSHA